jgi:hypothetical protein
MFVTLKVYKLIGPSNDGQRHGRGTYLFIVQLMWTLLALDFFVNALRISLLLVK